VTPIQQKEALEADSIVHGPAFRGKSVSQSDVANNSALGPAAQTLGASVAHLPHDVASFRNV